MSNVKDFGASGDGTTDDTEAIRHAVRDGDGVLLFPPGDYRITETIEVVLDEHGRAGIDGSAGTATVIMAGPGPAFRLLGTHEGTGSPASVEPKVWASQRMPTVLNIAVAGEHEEADGFELVKTMQALFEGVLVRQARHGIHLVERNRNVLISHCHVYHNRGAGVFLDGVDLHQINVIGNHISYNRLGGIRTEGSAIRNLQVTGNDIEYNNANRHEAGPEPTAEIYVDATADGASVAEITIASNTIQATPSPGGSNIRIMGRLDQRYLSQLWTITGNIITNQQTNVRLSGCAGVSITGNIINSCENRNLLAEGCRRLIIASNNFGRHASQYGMGVRLVDSTDCTVSGCQFVDESEEGQESGASPLELQGCERINITGCEVLGGVPFGIALESCSLVNITGCMITDPRETRRMRSAIRWVGPGRSNLITGNTLDVGTAGDLGIAETASVRVGDDNLIGIR